MEKKEIVIIAIVTFIVVVLWVGVGILGSKSSVPENPNLSKLLEPINPNFDQQALDQISQIIPFSKADARPTPTPKPTPTPRPTPTPTPQSNAIPGGFSSPTPSTSNSNNLLNSAQPTAAPSTPPLPGGTQ